MKRAFYLSPLEVSSFWHFTAIVGCEGCVNCAMEDECTCFISAVCRALGQGLISNLPSYVLFFLLLTCMTPTPFFSHFVPSCWLKLSPTLPTHRYFCRTPTALLFVVLLSFYLISSCLSVRASRTL